MEVSSRMSLNATFWLARLKALMIHLHGSMKIEPHILVYGEWWGIITQFLVCSITFILILVLTSTCQLLLLLLSMYSAKAISSSLASVTIYQLSQLRLWCALCWDGHLCSKSRTRQSHAQGFSRTGPDITKGALNASGQLRTIYRHREHMLAHGLTGLVHTYIPRTIWLHPYGWSMDYYFTWGRLLYDWTVSEWHVYLWSLWSLSYMHTPSFYTYMYTFLRFRVHVKS